MKTTVANLIPQLSPCSGFRLFLQAELARRCSANAQYSLRSFAVFLGLNHSTLSQLLRGKRPLTHRTIENLGIKLGMNQTEIERYKANENLATFRTSAMSRQIRQLTVDTVNLLSDPTHRAILELVRLEDFQPDSRWIARVLNSNVDEVNVAISRLTRLGLLEMEDHNHWVDRSGAVRLGQDAFANLIVQRLSEQVRRLSTQNDSREFAEPNEAASAKLLISATQLQSLMALLEKFQSESTTINGASDRYQLEINISPINQHNQPERWRDGKSCDAVSTIG
ncbi:MAG: TIGR02147 family protein [Acidobacteria bacterium]|nr:TIGR02147 family protein [Acidobacteriota bacterium]